MWNINCVRIFYFFHKFFCIQFSLLTNFAGNVYSLFGKKLIYCIKSHKNHSDKDFIRINAIKIENFD